MIRWLRSQRGKQKLLAAVLLTAQFKALVDKACLYRNARRLADNHRDHNVSSEQVAIEEKVTRQAFAEAYKAFYENDAATATS